MKRTLLLDVLIILFIGLFGTHLIAFYLSQPHLDTGYPDWLVHAFRIERMWEYGIQPWDHIWGNGLNIWRGYHVFSHLPALGLMYAFGLSSTQSMLWVTAGLFVGLRVVIYIGLRCARISPLFSSLAVLLSFTFPQQWATMRDYAAFVSLAYLVIFVLVWIATYSRAKWIYVLSAMAGAGVLAHPIVGMTCSVLLGLRVLSWQYRSDVKRMLALIGLWSVGATAFLFPVLSTSPRYSSPLLGSIDFFRMTILGPYVGLGALLMGGLLVGWLGIIIYNEHISQWAKVLHLALSLYVLAIVLGLQGLLPEQLIALQFSRTVAHVGILLPFSLAGIAQGVFASRRPYLLSGAAAALFAVVLIFSLDTASSFSATPIAKVEDPVMSYVNEQQGIAGSLLYKNLGESTYLASDNVRLALSYNDHLLPSPIALRLRQMLQNEQTFTTLSQSQAELINDYSYVLGVEYIAVPEFTPLDKAVQREGNGYLSFEKVATAGTFAILRSQYPVHHAYIVDRGTLNGAVGLEVPTMPSLSGRSYRDWDRAMTQLAQVLRSEEASVPVAVRFDGTSQLTIDISATDLASFKDPVLFVNQHIDPFWKSSVHIEKSPLGFMVIPVSAATPSQITLQNMWPNWYWPLQLSPLGVMVVTFVLTLVPWRMFKRFSFKPLQLLRLPLAWRTSS